MAEEVKTTEVTEKEVSTTELFKEHIQKIVFQTTGNKISKSTAWELYKNIFHGSVEFVLNQESKKVPLAGVATLEILETKPRGSKAGLDKDGNKVGEAWNCVPRFRVYPSSKVDDLVEFKYGLGEHTDVVEKHYGLYKSDDEVAAEQKAKADKAKERAEKAQAKRKDAKPNDTDAAVSEALAGFDEI